MYISTLNTLLSKMDVEGFIAAGAPADEYLNQATLISDAILTLDAHARTAEYIAPTITDCVGFFCLLSLSTLSLLQASASTQ